MHMKAIGEITPTVIEQRSSTGERLPSISVSDWPTPQELRSMPLEKVRMIASTPLPELAAYSPNKFQERLRFLFSLPKKNVDDIGGEVQRAIYTTKLGRMPCEQLDFLIDYAIDNCRWMPSVAECLEIAEKWQRMDNAFRCKRVAKTLLFEDKEKRFAATMSALAARTYSQSQIDALPEYWAQVAEERGYLCRIDGGFVLREVR